MGEYIDEYYDPQYAPDTKPNFYMYMIDGDTYYFAIHTHQRYAFSKNVASDYQKVEVSNVGNTSVDLVVTSDILFSSELFKKATNQPIKKPEFFRQREQADLHASKRE